jgi:hypothetical protein
MRWPRTDVAMIPRKHGSEFGLDAIPVSIVHHRPSRKITDPRPGYGSPGAQMKKAGLVVNKLDMVGVRSRPQMKQPCRPALVALKKFRTYAAVRRADEGTALRRSGAGLSTCLRR